MMADVDGTYETTVKTPMGEQNMTLTVVTDGATFSGSGAGAMGSMDITNGTVEGNTLGWTMQITSPMPMKLTCTATVDGDTLTGSVGAGGFGKFPIKGTRKA